MPGDKPLAILGGLTAQAFLTDYWQKKPLFVKNAFTDIQQMISADELAGLSLEETVESRIIQELPDNQWRLSQGPFNEATFSSLPESYWTLIVQAVDQHLPEFSQLLSDFNFLPSWRLDDIMITYATDQGSVGPHYDYYDVFLIQLAGNRHWQIGQSCNDETPLLPNLPVRILKDFEISESWQVEPGDLLYLPPGIAHHGIANGECMTMSVGFRAPSNKDLLSAFTDYMMEQLPDNQRYCDPNQLPQENTGWVSPETIEQIKQRLVATLNSDDAIVDWFGRFITTEKYEEPGNLSPTEQDLHIEDLLEYCQQGCQFYRNESARLTYTGPSHTTPEKLFINGEPVDFSPSSNALVQLICHQRVLKGGNVLDLLANHQDNQSLFLFLLGCDVFYIEEF